MQLSISGVMSDDCRNCVRLCGTMTNSTGARLLITTRISKFSVTNWPVRTGSGYNIRLDGQPVDRKSVENRFSRWLSRPFGQVNSECGNRSVPRTVFVEEIVTTPDGTAPVMMNIFAAGGRTGSRSLCNRLERQRPSWIVLRPQWRPDSHGARRQGSITG
jgi:hypothetical protein